jgi:hypothetical protein
MGDEDEYGETKTWVLCRYDPRIEPTTEIKSIIFPSWAYPCLGVIEA